MIDEERKQEWIKNTMKDRMRMLYTHKCDKCGQVYIGVGIAINRSFLCLNCLGDMLFEKPGLDVKNFARI